MPNNDYQNWKDQATAQLQNLQENWRELVHNWDNQVSGSAKEQWINSKQTFEENLNSLTKQLAQVDDQAESDWQKLKEDIDNQLDNLANSLQDMQNQITS